MGLSLTVQPSPFESATSWTSRLSARNGISHVQDFVPDMGLDWKRFYAGDQSTITQLCELAEVNPASVLLHSMIKDSAGIKRLNREVIGSKVILNREMSVCAQCVEDARCAKTGRLTAGARVWWQLAHVRSCYRHNVMFTALPAPQRGRCKYDFVGRIRDNAELVSRAATKPRSAFTRNFELYMISRVCREKRRRNRWLDALELRVAAQACQALGIVLKNRGGERTDQNSPEFLAWAAEVGFRALSQGPRSMWPAMRKVQDRSSFRGSGFYTDFQPFARFVERLDDLPGNQEIKDQVRDYVEHNYPVAAGEDVIGRAAKNRRLHSLVSATEKTGTSWTRMRGVFQIIRDTGAVGHLTPPDRNLWVGCEEWDPWLEKYGTCLNIKRAASRLGVSFPAFQAIEKEGWIKPFISLPGHVDRFDPDVR